MNQQLDLFAWADKRPVVEVYDLCPLLIVRAATGLSRYGEMRQTPAVVLSIYPERKAS